MELWIARDLDGSLYLYTEKPCLVSNSYFDTRSIDGEHMYLGDYSRCTEITFENSPQKVELKLL